MSSKVYTDTIQRYLLLYSDLIENSNSLGLTDDAINAENVFRSILNIAFGWKLINSNEKRSNQDSFDLEDKTRSIYIQVTSNKGYARKRRTALQSFLNSHEEKKQKEFFILFISKKCSPAVLKNEKFGNVTFYCMDIPTLMKKIYFNNPNATDLEKVAKLLQKEVLPVLLDFGIVDRELRGSSVIQDISSVNKDFYIKRTELIRRIFDFIRDDNGLLIGGHGFGKSFILEELQRFCRSNKTPCIIIRINELADGTDIEINQLLQTKHRWLDVLANEELSDKGEKAILVFDAFDTAKDSQLKQTILKQIRKSIQTLNSKWNVLVSVRSFDASKSPQLHELFPTGDLNKDVTCRHLEIPKLSVQELLNTVEGNDRLNRIYKKANRELKELLRIPYFLTILNQVLQQNQKLSITEIAHIESEEQLLNYYWKTNVADTSNLDTFLYTLTFALAQKECLIIDKGEVLNGVNSQLFDELNSRGLLHSVSFNSRKIAFSHNILLDYALSRYVIPEDASSLIQFVSNFEKMPFIFRQAFVYFYGKLWREYRDIFWVHYSNIRKEQSPLFRLFHQTIINYVVVEFYKDAEELIPLFDDPDKIVQGRIINKLLEANRFVNSHNFREKDFHLFKFISQQMHWAFLWEFGRQLNDIICLLEKIDSISLSKWKLISEASCNYWDFVLSERTINSSKRILIDRNSSFGIDNLCRVIKYNKEKVQKLIRKTFHLLQEEDFPIRTFHSLADCISKLYDHDKKFSNDVFKELYYHRENSSKKTSLGGVVLSLTSNRSQDYSLIHYTLETEFPNLLEIYPDEVLPLGIEIINKYDSSVHDRRYNLNVNGIEAYLTIGGYIEDIIDDAENDSRSFGANIFKYLIKLVETRQSELLHKCLAIFIKEAHTCSMWRRFLKFLAQFPETLSDISFSLLSNDRILFLYDTSEEAGTVISAVWPYLKLGQKKVLEKNILNLKEKNQDDQSIRYQNMRISRLLNCIPAGEATLKETNVFLSKNAPIENKPTFRGVVAANIVPRTIDDEMHFAGFDVKSRKDIKEFKEYKVLEEFNKTFGKVENKPSREDFEKIFSLLIKLFEKVKNFNTLNERRCLSYDCAIAKSLNILTISSIKFKREHKQFFIHAFQFYIMHPIYKKSIIDEEINATTYNIDPRSDTARAVANMLKKDKTNQLSELMLTLANDADPYVRREFLNVATWFWHNKREDFWKVIAQRSISEYDEFCLLSLASTLQYSDIISEGLEKIDQAAINMLPAFKLLKGNRAGEVWSRYVVLLLKLFLFHNSSIARSIIYENLDNYLFSSRLIFSIAETIDPHNNKSKDFNYDSLFILLSDILDFRFDSLCKKDLDIDDITEDFKIIDQCVHKLYFTITKGKGNNKNKEVERSEIESFFIKIKPILSKTVEHSTQLDSGFMVAHTGYYFMQLLNFVFDFDPPYVLSLAFQVVNCAAANGFTYDSITLREIVMLTEKVLTDHKTVLNDKESFHNLLTILDQFANSGWQEALELTWRLKEAF